MSDDTTQDGSSGGDEQNTDFAVKLEQLQKERDEAIAKAAEAEKIKEDYEKLKKKDLNFGKLRRDNMSKEKALEGATEKERMLLEEQESLKERQERLEKESERMREATRKRLLRKYAGEEKAMQEKVEYQYSRIKDEAYTEEEMEQKMADAAKLAEAPMKQVSMGLAASSYGIPDRTTNKKKSFTDTEDGQDLAKKMGLGHLFKS